MDITYYYRSWILNKLINKKRVDVNHLYGDTLTLVQGLALRMYILYYYIYYISDAETHFLMF